ncbi:toxic anion resistance protein [Xylanimonas sp. McL0601]|uniref:toxic anion resistance protein n=1 Tax=Xylanimonas sp. McL0601 TaxID=3414739 RepID=UPI003CE72E98
MTDTPKRAVDVDFNALLGGADPTAVPLTPLEQAVGDGTGDVTADTAEGFQFRSLLTEEQRASLTAGAPALAERIAGDLNTVLTFGAPVMQRLNDASVQLLQAQEGIDLPQADVVVNDLLREMDGFESKYRNAALEEAAGKFRSWFKRTKASFEVMVRESRPIADRLDLAEVKLQEMEQRIGDNITRGQLLHKQSLQHMDQVVGVLAALEEVTDLLRDDVAAATATLTAAQASHAMSVELKGATVSTGEMTEIHAKLTTALSETEKTWHDWRQQFFMGFANAPSTRNLVMTQFSLRRRLSTFRTMGIPQARQALVMWQQAALAQEGAELGENVQAGVNRLVQQSFGATADAVGRVAQASQAPVITEETVWAVVDSVRAQCQAIVAADAAGRELRARDLKALAKGEVTIRDEYTAMQRRLAAAQAGGSTSAAAPGATADPVEGDFLAGLEG